MAHCIIAYFALEFPGRRYLKAKKTILAAYVRVWNPIWYPQLPQSSSSANPCCLIRKRLESHPFSNYHQSLGAQTRPNQHQGSRSHPAASSSFTNASEIYDVTPLSTKASAMDFLLWRGYCRHSRIKDLPPAAYSLCKFTWEAVVFMVLTGKRRLGPDIWPEIPQ